MLRRGLLLGIGDLRLHLAERIVVTVARHSAGGDRRLQLRTSLVVGGIGFELIALELRFGVKERRVRCRMVAAQGLGASAERRPVLKIAEIAIEGQI
jgi:hypothetical protein